MLYAKISPSAKAVKLNGLFDASIIDADYMTAFADPYGLGTDSVVFKVNFGVVELENGNPASFTVYNTMYITLDEAQISTWGTNDQVVLEEIASVLNLSILQFINF